MKSRFQRVLNRILCVVLSLAMLSGLSLTTFAQSQAQTTETVYVKDVKLIYADSKEEARTYVPEGYTLIEDDLNAGTDGDGVYLAYSTTTKSSEAVTDIKMMNMKGGFVLSDYEEQVKDAKDSVKSLANDVKIASKMFAENYVKGTYGAKAAYRALSVFTVDDEGKQNFADYLLYGNPGDDFYIRFVLNAHQNVLSAVLSALAMAVQGELGDTWLDRLEKIENPNDVKEQDTYWDDATTLWEHFYSFYNVYKTIDHSLYDVKYDPNGSPDGSEGENPTTPPAEQENQPDIDNNGTEALYELTYRALKERSFGNEKKFSDWFLGADVFVPGDERIENFYCMLEVMTPEELAMMRLCGPLYMILATGMDDASYNDYIKRIEEITEGAETCSIWVGVNTELFRSSIGITDDAARRIAETNFEKELNNEGDSLGMAGLKTAGLVAACGAVSLGLGLATYYGFGAFMLTCFSGTSLTSVASAVSIAGTIFGAAALTAGIAIIVVALVVALVFLFVWLAELHDEYHPEYTEIPEFMYDYVEDDAKNSQFVLYESVKFQDGRVADVNTWDGKEWHAMYVSHDKAAGAPIEANFIVSYGDGRIGEGYAGLSNFGHVNAQNFNGYDFDDDVGGIYITYPQKKLEGDYARMDYLHDVKLFSDEDAAKAINELNNKGYTLYDINLTPDSDCVTYLGYKTTNNKSRALTDIRVAYGYNSTQYSLGGNNLSYGASGSAGEGKLTLYTTSISLFGSPIRSDFLILENRNAPAGYEPVNLFSGGPAVNLNMREDDYANNTKSFYFYFLPSVAYTSGTEYLGGIVTIFDKAKKNDDNGIGSIDRANSKHLGYKLLYTTTGDDNLEGSIGYTVTYNPYRAIYGITSVSASEEMGKAFAQTISYDGTWYSIAGRYLVTCDEDVTYETENRNNDVRLYTTGIYNGGAPMLVSDILATADQNTLKEGFVPVTARFLDDSGAVNLAKGFTQRFNADRPGGKPTWVSLEPFYLFIKGEEYREGNYVTDLYLVSKEELLVLADLDIDCSDLDTAYVMNQLALSGAHKVILNNLNLCDSDNSTYLGYTKKIKDDSVALLKPITNIVLYYAGETDVTPEDKLTFDGISYERAGSSNIFCEEDGQNETCKRVYVYYTTNPAAGSPIIDIKIDNTAILNGWETVRTQNKKALYADMDDYSSSMWFIHAKRITEDPKYISEVVVGIGGSEAEAKAELIAAGCDYMLEKDLNSNVGAHSDYIYLGYKRTSDPNEAIRDLRTTHDDDVASFVKNGATYYKIDGNLNSYTNVFADDIFLYYTKDSKAGTPIISLGTSGSEANWSHGDSGQYVVKTVLNQYDKASDLNKNCGRQSDYIYLLQTRDKTDQAALASMLGNGSVVIVISCAVISAGAIIYLSLSQRKRRVKVEAEQDDDGTSQD